VTTLLPRPLLLACAIALFALGTAYQVKGNIDLIGGDTPSSAVDLKNRDMEQAFFMEGRNPHGQMVGSQPPWSYQFGQLLTWPAWPAVRAYFASLNLLALAFLMLWVYHLARDVAFEGRLLLMAAVFAFGGSCTATEVGQVSIIVTALLAGALWCDRAGHPYASGLLVALAMIKPTMAAPFAVALIVAGRYQAAGMAAAYGVAATAITWVVTATSPMVMLQQMANGAAAYITDGTFGPVDLAALLGASPAAMVWVPLSLAVPGLVLMAMVRPSLPLCFAIATVWARLWTYHKSYDDVMLVFVLVPLGILALGAMRSRAAAVGFFAMGLLAWVPGRVLAMTEVQIAQLAVWPLALLVLVHLERVALRVRWAIPHGSAARDPLAT
jgi:Glycosyltransferase family 87